MRKIIKCMPSVKRIKDKVINNKKAHFVEKIVAKCMLDIKIFFFLSQKLEKENKSLLKASKAALSLHKSFSRQDLD